MMMSRFRSLFHPSLIGLFLVLPFFSRAQLLSNDDGLKKVILDAEAVQAAAKKFPVLEAEYLKMNALLDGLTPVTGYQRRSLPIAMRPLQGELKTKVAQVCSELTALMEACRAKLKADKASLAPEDFVERETILRADAGCYYLGLNENLLCDNELHAVMTTLQLQDYPFVEAAEYDKCLWDIAANVPRLADLVVFGCDIDDATLVEMHLEKCNGLRVLHLDENDLTVVPLQALNWEKLKYLGLSKNDITHLPADLKPMTGLVCLELYGNPIPPEELARIKNALPNTAVMFR